MLQRVQIALKEKESPFLSGEGLGSMNKLRQRYAHLARRRATAATPSPLTNRIMVPGSGITPGVWDPSVMLSKAM
ncbi:MAG: hypothetical protein WHX60_04025 [Armatimonadota bacterium]